MQPPPWTLKWPAGHGWQASPLPDEPEPAGHGEHDVLPATPRVSVLAAQGTHPVLPEKPPRLARWLTGHGVHTWPPPAE